MKKTALVSLALSVFSSALLIAADPPKQAVSNGKFTETTPIPKNAQGIAGTVWAKHWSCVGTAELKDGKIVLTSGVIYQFLPIVNNPQPYLLKGEIKASALPGKQGVLTARLSTCIRKDSKEPFSHSIQKKFGPFQLTESPQVFPFECRLEPYEQGYLYIGESNAVIESVSLTATPVQ
ncbi:MAG: hypothetical protein BWY31_02937 [Lentisphaerae bacterium ADurb.Bin242]|nr:MAG: hypothetical protein BWY31_02937 [Lentisphaerae bacterium ADurb.Bin242]